MRLLSPSTEEQGFSLIEVLIALLITGLVMASVYGLLKKGQDSFQREPQVADMNQSARSGLQRISQDLSLAGLETPPVMAIMWQDGGGTPPNPDELTIVYADAEVPTSRPLTCAETPGPCKTIDKSSVLYIEPDSFEPPLYNPDEPMDDEATQQMESAYENGMTLMAIDFGTCGDNTPGIVPFQISQDPMLNQAGGRTSLKIVHNPGQSDDINLPGGFNRAVDRDCAVIGMFHVVQYRVNPPPPTANPLLERRDLAMVGGGTWIPVSNNIENLQVQYALGSSDIFVDEPAMAPQPDDPATWITRVKVTIVGRTESTNLQGATTGVFASEDTHMRKTFSTTTVLRNQVYSAAELSDNAKYN